MDIGFLLFTEGCVGLPVPILLDESLFISLIFFKRSFSFTSERVEDGKVRSKLAVVLPLKLRAEVSVCWELLLLEPFPSAA